MDAVTWKDGMCETSVVCGGECREVFEEVTNFNGMCTAATGFTLNPRMFVIDIAKWRCVLLGRGSVASCTDISNWGLMRCSQVKKQQ